MDGKGDRVKPNWVLISLTGAFDRRPGQSQALREATSGACRQWQSLVGCHCPDGRTHRVNVAAPGHPASPHTPLLRIRFRFMRYYYDRQQ
jgi:hypothetical protein